MNIIKLIDSIPEDLQDDIVQIHINRIEGEVSMISKSFETASLVASHLEVFKGVKVSSTNNMIYIKGE